MKKYFTYINFELDVKTLHGSSGAFKCNFTFKFYFNHFQNYTRSIKAYKSNVKEFKIPVKCFLLSHIYVVQYPFYEVKPSILQMTISIHKNIYIYIISNASFNSIVQINSIKIESLF